LASWIRIQRGKISTKNCNKNFYLLNPKSELLKKREIIKISSFLNGSLSFRGKHRIKTKMLKKKKFSKSGRNDLDPDPDLNPDHFFQCGSASRLRNGF